MEKWKLTKEVVYHLKLIKCILKLKTVMDRSKQVTPSSVHTDVIMKCISTRVPVSPWGLCMCALAPKSNFQVGVSRLKNTQEKRYANKEKH